MTYPYTDGIPGITTPDASGNSIYNDGGPGGSLDSTATAGTPRRERAHPHLRGDPRPPAGRGYRAARAATYRRAGRVNIGTVHATAMPASSRRMTTPPTRSPVVLDASFSP